jgi:hypothetical protein
MTDVKIEQGTKDLEKVIELASKNILLGLEIARDGVGSEDVIHLPAAFENVKELVAFVASKPNLAEEIKDIDVLEGIALIKKAYDEYKKISEEVKA